MRVRGAHRWGKTYTQRVTFIDEPVHEARADQSVTTEGELARRVKRAMRRQPKEWQPVLVKALTNEELEAKYGDSVRAGAALKLKMFGKPKRGEMQ